MKRFFTKFILISLYVAIISNIVYAQLPFEPFAAFNGNPVLPATQGTWDEFAVWYPNVIFVNDTFYMTYIGTNDLNNTAVTIGLATSSDGFNYAKSVLNPIFSGDGGGFDGYNTSSGVLFFSDPTWYLYYTGRSTAPNQPGNVTGRAMSNTSPHGPWTRSDDTLLAVGSPGEWDSEFIQPETIVENGSELIMYYLAGDTWPSHPQIGMATSTDGGLTWEKYNDPTTNTPPYVESDPVLKPDKPYDMNSLWGCTVLRHNTFWEMFYSGSNGTTVAICYATSGDGIIWEKDDTHNPIFIPSQDPIATNTIEKPSVVIVDGQYFMYYDYGITPDGIGLATAENLIVPGINLNPVALDFGGVAIDTFATMTFTIMNTGNADLDVSDISSNEPAFTVNITSTTVLPGNNQDVEVTFTPTEELAYNGVIEIVHNAAGSPDSVTVTGEGSPVVGIEDELLNTIPTEFFVYQNYPNPFNPGTTIEFALPNPVFVTLSIFNTLGERIATLVSENLTAGSYKYEWDASELTSGIYFYQLQAVPSGRQAGDFVETKKMILLK